MYLLGHGRSFKSPLTGRIIQTSVANCSVHGRFMTSDQFELPIGINKQRDGTTEVKISGQIRAKIGSVSSSLTFAVDSPGRV